ncbi:hypothetical protein C8J56DRAFT_894168 [Mycena floridula]|nr:hypothetical protein C8J56DRAFT_894168 [Mycena floridula]
MVRQYPGRTVSNGISTIDWDDQEAICTAIAPSLLEKCDFWWSFAETVPDSGFPHCEDESTRRAIRLMKKLKRDEVKVVWSRAGALAFRPCIYIQFSQNLCSKCDNSQTWISDADAGHRLDHRPSGVNDMDDQTASVFDFSCLTVLGTIILNVVGDIPFQGPALGTRLPAGWCNLWKYRLSWSHKWYLTLLDTTAQSLVSKYSTFSRPNEKLLPVSHLRRPDRDRVEEKAYGICLVQFNIMTSSEQKVDDYEYQQQKIIPVYLIAPLDL